MAKAELGLKRTCVACGTRFYDLTRTPAVCPKCGTEQPAEQPRARRAAPLPEEKPKKRVPAGDTPDIEDVDAEEVADDAAVEDADDLEDDDDIAEDIAVEGGDEEET
ncbi:TIGR02300 family protein [Roseomonas sp. CCTCC AB2023176]|uniref:TIGR02300 family protein n=1 Tax=Roseomonas sp. CCTCC AB2023176 TaxID=3342640 RepID=UPI0035D64F1B